MGAQDAQVVITHPAQVGHGNGGVQSGLQPHRIPIGLHIGIVGVAGAVDGVVKGVIDGRRAHPLVLGQLLQLFFLQLRQSGSVLLLRVCDQNAAQRTAVVGKAHHAVFGVGVHRALLHKALPGQFFQLLQGCIDALVLAHPGVILAVGQLRDCSICLLHPAHIRSRQALLHSGGFLRLLCKSRHGQSCQCKSQRTQHTHKAAGSILFHSHSLRACRAPMQHGALFRQAGRLPGR